MRSRSRWCGLRTLEAWAGSEGSAWRRPREYLGLLAADISALFLEVMYQLVAATCTRILQASLRQNVRLRLKKFIFLIIFEYFSTYI